MLLKKAFKRNNMDVLPDVLSDLFHGMFNRLLHRMFFWMLLWLFFRLPQLVIADICIYRARL